jgi:hypothetical protein
VPWWPEPYTNTNLFAVVVHVLGESIRQIDEEARAAHCAKIEQAARSAAPIKAWSDERREAVLAGLVRASSPPRA